MVRADRGDACAFGTTRPTKPIRPAARSRPPPRRAPRCTAAPSRARFERAMPRPLSRARHREAGGSSERRATRRCRPRPITAGNQRRCCTFVPTEPVERAHHERGEGGSAIGEGEGEQRDERKAAPLPAPRRRARCAARPVCPRALFVTARPIRITEIVDEAAEEGRHTAPTPSRVGASKINSVIMPARPAAAGHAEDARVGQRVAHRRSEGARRRYGQIAAPTSDTAREQARHPHFPHHTVEGMRPRSRSRPASSSRPADATAPFSRRDHGRS